MSEETSYSLVNLGPLSKPADTLIKKISNLVGGVLVPHQIKRVAEAEAMAAMIEAESEIQITDLQRRAAYRWMKEEEIRQENMEEITTKAIPLLNDDAKPDAMEDDWIANFFAKSRIVSDNEMQEMWARVLAGEANAPGTYSKRTVNFLSDLDKVEAEVFAKLCGFVWTIEKEVVLLVFDEKAEIYNRHGINFGILSHLDSIGLVQFNSLARFHCIVNSQQTKSPGRCIAHYYGKSVFMEMSKDGDNVIRVGNTLFTRIGRELARICGSKPVDGFYEYVRDQWKQYLAEAESSVETKI